MYILFNGLVTQTQPTNLFDNEIHKHSTMFRLTSTNRQNITQIPYS